MASSVSAMAAGGGKASGMAAWQGRVALVGRILIAAIFVTFGFNKLAQPAMTMAYMAAAGLPFAELGYTGRSAIRS